MTTLVRVRATAAAIVCTVVICGVAHPSSQRSRGDAQIDRPAATVMPSERVTRTMTDREARAVTGKVDRERVAAGRVTAIVNGVPVEATAASLPSLAAREAIFVEKGVRSAPVAMTAPQILQKGTFPNVVGPPNSSALRSSTLLTSEVVLAVAATGSVRSKVYLSDTGGLTYSGARRAYDGQVGIAFVNADSESDESMLPRPVSILVQAPGAVVTPQPIEVLQLGRWYTARLTVATPADPYRVVAKADPRDPGDEVTISIVHPTVSLTATTPRIVGYGLGHVELAVSASGISEPEGTVIDIGTDRGQLSSSTVVLDGTGHGAVSLRSGGVGTATIRPAILGGAPLDVEFLSPWPFLLLAGGGGFVGAFLQKRGRRKWAKAIAVSVVTAIVMTVAYAVGLDWLVRSTGWSQVADSGEAVVFVLGLLGSFVGVRALVPTRG